MSSIAVFLVLGGATAFAASQLGKNTVGTKQLKKNAVTAAKIKKNAITTPKIKADAVTGAQVNEGTLGTVPSANSAATANVANSLAPMEATHIVGAPGQPAFENGSANVPSELGISFNPVGFYKDHDGIVHLQGVAIAGNNGSGIVPIFTLPPGFRPGTGKLIIGGALGGIAVIGGPGASFPPGINLDSKVAGEEEELVLLDGITFRAEN